MRLLIRLMHEAPAPFRIANDIGASTAIEPDRGGAEPLSLSRIDAILDYRDVEGRPLGEGRASECVAREAGMTSVRCPYPGSRHGANMNTAALHQAMTHWPATEGVIASLSIEYIRRRSDATKSLEFLLGFALTATAIPGYLIHRRPTPCRDGDLPTVVAVLYKAMLGVALAASRQIERRILDGVYQADAAIDTEGVLCFAEEASLLVGGRGEACAAPTSLIRRALEAILVPPSSRGSVQSDLSFTETDSFFRYASLASALPVVVLVASALLEPLASEIARILVTLEPELGEDLALSDQVDGPLTLSVSLTSLSPEQFESGFSTLMRILGDFDGRVADRVEGIVFPEGRSAILESEDSLGGRLARRIIGSLPSTADSISGDLARLLLRYHHLEGEMLEVLSVVEVGLNRALGRREPIELPDPSLIPQRLTARHLEFLRRRFAIEVEHRMSRSTLYCGRDRLLIRASGR